MDVIWPGTPGEAFVNDTGQVLYQFICSFFNTCGACAQHHLAVAKWWSRLHHGCNCISVPIMPGGSSRPYEDWRGIVDNLPPDQQSKLVGASSFRLIEAGVVRWEDVVTPTRVRSLVEVTSRGNLTVEQLTGAGVRRDIAEKAHAAVNTPEHRIVEQQRADLVRKITDLGIRPQHLAEMFGERMAERIGIGGGPSGPGWMPPADTWRTTEDWVWLIVGSYGPGDLSSRLDEIGRLEAQNPEAGPTGPADEGGDEEG